MRSISKILVLIVILSSLQSYAQSPGHGVGNGGGVICIKGTCKTLIESGLQVDLNYPDFWLPDNALQNEVNRQVSQFPFIESERKMLLGRIFLKMTHFKKVEVVDQSKLDAIVQKYKDTLIASNPALDLTFFEIAAISSDDTVADPHTFLLPSFYKLDTQTKAKLLIHEGIYRGQNNSMLKQVLQLESALSVFNNATLSKLNLEDLKEKTVTAQIALFNLNLISRSQFLVDVVHTMVTSSVELYKNYSFQNYGIGVMKENLLNLLFFATNGSKTKLALDSQNLLSTNFDTRVKAFLLNLDFSNSSCTSYTAFQWGNKWPVGKYGYPTYFDAFIYVDLHQCVLSDLNKMNFILPQ